MKNIVFLAAGLIALSACATTTDSGSGETSASADNGPKVICRTEKVLGSNKTEKICRQAD